MMENKVNIPKEIFTLPEDVITCNYKIGNSKKFYHLIVHISDDVCEKYGYHSGDVLENTDGKIIIIGVSRNPLSFDVNEHILLFYDFANKRINFRKKFERRNDFKEAGYKLIDHINLL